MGFRPAGMPADSRRAVTVLLPEEVYRRLSDWAKGEKQPIEVIIAETLRAHVGLG